eukprot:4532143-Karenia_brevis.AAC.1
MLPWIKRHILANFSFFQCYSIPESAGTEWLSEACIAQAVPRCEVACAVCARRDFIEYRYKCYLWATPESRVTSKTPKDQQREEPIRAMEVDSAEPNMQSSGSPGSTGAQSLLLQRDGIFCLGSPESINKHLATYNYSKLMPLIPKEELYASSVRHPKHPEMIWLLHSRRVPLLEDGVELESRRIAVQDSGVPYTVAGTGDPEATVWA